MVAGQASAAVVYSTDFNAPTYSDGGIIGQDSWLITGSSVVSPISIANSATNGNVTLANTGQDVNRVFTPAITAGGATLSADITITAANATGDYFLHLGDGGASNFYARIYAKAGTAANTFQLAMGTSSGATGLVYGADLAFATTYRITARYDLVAGTLNDTGAILVNDVQYVNALTTGTDATSIASVNIRQGSTGPAVTIDNITVDSIPEPTSLGLIGLGALILGRRRRA